jgi:hypothetical protein
VGKILAHIDYLDESIGDLRAACITDDGHAMLSR